MMDVSTLLTLHETIVYTPFLPYCPEYVLTAGKFLGATFSLQVTHLTNTVFRLTDILLLIFKGSNHEEEAYEFKDSLCHTARQALPKLHSTADGEGG